eukprot:11537192-Alexandrium_andersonii.AAC.1
MCIRDRTKAVSFRESVGIPWIPKQHLFVHLCHEARVVGSPRFYATFLDESCNGRLTKLAAVRHRLTWRKR